MLVTITDTISIVSTSCSEMQRKYAEVAITFALCSHKHEVLFITWTQSLNITVLRCFLLLVADDGLCSRYEDQNVINVRGKGSYTRLSY